EALRACPHASQHAGEAEFVLGSACLRLAERSNGVTAAEWYRQARAHLEQAENLGVPSDDHFRLLHRLGKACYHTQAPPQRRIDSLAPALGQSSDDPAEGYVLLTDCYMRLPTPNLSAALEANTRLLNLPAVPDDLLSPARLLRGELLISLKDPVKAREALE